MQVVQDLLQPFGTTTIIQGRVIKIHGDNLDIATAAGTALLKRNLSTYLERLDGVDINGFQFKNVLWEELEGHYCVCRIIAYSLSSNTPPRRHTLFSLVSFGPNCSLLKNPGFHSRSAAWLAKFWLASLDTEHGGVFANVLNGGVYDPGSEGNEKWSYITSRSVAGFAFAFQLTGELEFLQAANHGMDFLKSSSVDKPNGHLFFRSRQMRDGRPHPDASPLLNIFVHEYALTGPLRFFAATADNSTYKFIEQGLESLMFFHDANDGGFFDGLERTTLRPVPGVTSTKSFTSSADLLAAAVIFAKELECYTPNFDPKAVLSEVCEIIVHRHLTEGNAFIIESLNANWLPNSSSWRNEYATVDIAGNCGATAKVARVLAVSLPLLPPTLQQETRCWIQKILDGLLSVGVWDPVRGGVYDVMLRDSRIGETAEFVYHGDFVWWVQEQLCVAAYLGFLLFENHHYLEVARSILRFWLCCFNSRRGGVHDTVDHAGNPVSTHMGRWVKNSYHELEFAYFASAFEAIINNKPITLYFAPRHPGPYINALPDIGVVQWTVLDKEELPNGVIAVKFTSDRVPVK